MSDAPDQPPPPQPQTPPTPIDYESPTVSRLDRRRVVLGAVAGLVGGVVIVVATPFVCAFIDAQLNPTNDGWEGFGGFLLGVLLGGLLLLTATGVAFMLHRRRRQPLLRGVSLGLLATVALTALTAGACAIAI